MTGTAVSWLVPWHAVDDPHKCAAQERELARELSPAHVLFGCAVKLLAARQDCDTVLFALPDGKVAEVHLTWKGAVETDPIWPGTGIYPSLETWIAESMLPEHEDWTRSA